MANTGKFKSGLISGRAPGYWGRNPNRRIQCEYIVDKVLSLNYDKVYAMGLPYSIWREASSIYSNLQRCSCFKDTTKQPDIACGECYGTGYIPGYIKFGTQNYWMESTNTNWTLTNLGLDKDNRPFRLHLTYDFLTGTAVSPLIPISTLSKVGNWEYRVNAFTRDGGINSSVLVEFAKDGGSVWYDLSQLDVQLPTTSIQLRVTITRSAATVKSPVYEITRLRFPTLFDIRDELNEPVIRVLPTWDNTAEFRTPYGNRIDTQNKKFWCLPLPFYDETISSTETNLARLMDDCFAESRYGATLGTRFALINFAYSDTFSKFTRQDFSLRECSGSNGKLSGEVYYRVF